MTLVFDGIANTVAGLAVGGLGTGVVDTATLAAAAVTPVKTQVGVLPSMVRLDGGNGFGSTNTVIRRFTTTVLNQGTDITYADSATLGATFTINTNGVYAVTYFDAPLAVAPSGLSLNSSQLTTGIGGITTTDRLTMATPRAGTDSMAVSWTGYLAAGAVIRVHTSAGSSATAAFTIVRIA